jgi:hypothetical protein
MDVICFLENELHNSKAWFEKIVSSSAMASTTDLSAETWMALAGSLPYLVGGRKEELSQPDIYTPIVDALISDKGFDPMTAINGLTENRKKAIKSLESPLAKAKLILQALNKSDKLTKDGFVEAFQRVWNANESIIKITGQPFARIDNLDTLSEHISKVSSELSNSKSASQVWKESKGVLAGYASRQKGGGSRGGAGAGGGGAGGGGAGGGGAAGSSSFNANNNFQNQFTRNIPGYGIVDANGRLTRGTTRNAGGGLLDTVVGQTGLGGVPLAEGATPNSDVVISGPQSVQSATKTYRAALPTAGAEDVRPSEEDNLQSDALFEAFSWVPDGYGLGANNRLHNLNRQHDNIRYGIEQLYEPRCWQEYGHPIVMKEEFDDDMGPRKLVSEYADRVRRKRGEDTTKMQVKKRPLDTVPDGYLRDISAKDLPTSKYPVWSQPIIKPKDSFKATLRPTMLSAVSGVDKNFGSYHGISM